MRNTLTSLLAVLLLAGCGATSAPNDEPAAVPTSTAPEVESVPDPTATTVATTSVTPSSTHDSVPLGVATTVVEDPLVAFEAKWLCEVQRRSFPDLGAMEDLRVELLAEAEITSEEYAGLQATLADDPDMRSAVLNAFQVVCSG